MSAMVQGLERSDYPTCGVYLDGFFPAKMTTDCSPAPSQAFEGLDNSEGLEDGNKWMNGRCCVKSEPLSSVSHL